MKARGLECGRLLRLAALGVWLLGSGGCTGDLTALPPPPGAAFFAGCMCALCLNVPFCQTDDPADPYERVGALGDESVCTDAAFIPALRTKPVANPVGGGFPARGRDVWCLPPDLDGVFGPIRLPQPDESILASDFRELYQLSDVDTCLDIPDAERCAAGLVVPPECPPAPGCVPHPDRFYFPIAAVCIAQAGRSDTDVFRDAVDKMALGCDLGDGLGSLEPDRYCFLSTIFTERNGPGEFRLMCATIDPAHVAAGSSPVELVSNVSMPTAATHVRIQIPSDGVDSTAPAGGDVALTLPGCGPGVACSGLVPLVTGAALTPIDIAGTVGRDIHLVNELPLPVLVTPLDATTSLIEAVGTTIPFYVSGDIDGVGLRGVSLATSPPGSSGALMGTVDWSSRTFSSAVTLRSADDSVIVTLDIVGNLTSLPPVASAGPDVVAECESPHGTQVPLSAAASTDPDGAADLSAFQWSYFDGTRDRYLGGSEVSPTLPLGSTDVLLRVWDSAGISDYDRVLATVVDTTAPEIGDASLVTDCLWPPNHRMHLFRLGDELSARATDACDAALADLRIVDVRSNQPADDRGDGSTAPDVSFGSDALCVRAERQGPGREAREYTVVLEAIDLSGNTSRREVIIRVPHDMGRDRCTTGSAAPEVDDDDPRCTTELPPLAVTTSTSTSGGSACSVSHGSTDSLPPVAILAFAILLGWRQRR